MTRCPHESGPPSRRQPAIVSPPAGRGVPGTNGSSGSYSGTASSRSRYERAYVNVCNGPSASIRPATTGSAAPGSQVQTNAVCGSEVVIDAHLPRIDVRRQQCETVAFAGGQAPQVAGREPVQLHANQRRKLEHHPNGHRRFAALGVAQRCLGNASALAQLSLRPPPPPTSFGDPQPQYARSIQRLRRVCVTTAHRALPDWTSTTCLFDDKDSIMCLGWSM